MKNIHVLPTDKPSRIYLIKSNNKLGITSNNPEFTENFGSGTQNQNIYITSDEEIKEDDWVLETLNGVRFKLAVSGNNYINSTFKKIILTDNKDLIKDNVQAIDDEFLEWFIKNPSCEEVEVNEKLIIIQDKPLVQHQGNKPIVVPHRINYKIIIPKEEPKQECLHQESSFRGYYKDGCYTFWGSGIIVVEELKQETIEEAAEKYVENFSMSVKSARQIGFIDGAKLQAERIGLMEIELNHTKTLLASCEKALEDRDKKAERRYSEEDLRKAILTSFLLGVDKGIYSKEKEDKIIEQFKKK